MERSPVSLRFLLTSVFLPAAFSLFSQQYSIRGMVRDSVSGESLRGAHVSLLDVTGGTVAAAISDGAGTFRLEPVLTGSYTLRLTFVGYEPLERMAGVGDRDLDMGILRMRPSVTALEGASITGQVPMAVQIGDTTQFNADAFTTMPDATAEDLVEKLPGVVVQEGKVEAMGEEVRQVTVDGRPFFRNDPVAALRTLPAEVVDKIQIFDKESDQAEFTGFSDGETVKTMNIITRTNMRNGIFGKANAGLGYGDEVFTGEAAEAGGEARYTVGGNINFFKDARRVTLVAQSNNVNEQNFSSEDLLGVMAAGAGRPQGQRGGSGGGGRGPGMGGGMGGGMPGEGPGGTSGSNPMGGGAGDFMVASQPGITTTHALGVNYSDLWGKKVEVTASYFFNFSDNQALEELQRTYTVGSDSGQAYSERSVTEGRNINHRLNLRLEYKINDNNTLFIRPRLTLQQNDGLSSFSGETVSGSTLLNSLLNSNDPDLSALSFSNTLLYRHRFEKERRTLSVSASMGANNQSGGSYLGAATEYLTPPASVEILDQHSLLKAAGWSVSGNLMYTEPVGKNGMVQLNYMASFQEDDSDKETFNFNEAAQDYTALDTLLSNLFYNHYITQRAGAGYLYNKNKLFFTGRVEYQHATLQNSQVFPSEYEMEHSYRNLLVNAMVRYTPSRTRNLNVVYNTSTRPPSISQLQEVVDNSNTVQLKSGNPDLEQTYTHNAFARFSSVNPGSSRVFFAMLSGSITSGYIANQTLYAVSDTLLGNGLLLKQGTQLTTPVNLDGFRSFRSFFTYGMPLQSIRVNLNLNLGYNFSRVPGLVNDLLNLTRNHGINLGVVISSNISEYIDFTLSSRSGFNLIHNSTDAEQDYNYFDQRTRFRFKGVLPAGGYLLESVLTHQFTSGLSESYDQNSWIWSAAVGKKLFHNRLGEIKLGIYDILDQSQSVRRNVGDIYVEDVENNILTRYVMLTFTYNLRRFEGTGQEPGRDQQEGPPPDFRRQMMPFRDEMN